MPEKKRFLIINLAYYFIFAATALMYRYKREFEKIDLEEDGKASSYLKSALEGINKARVALDIFEPKFRKASATDGRKWDQFQAVADELIALGSAYLTHSLTDRNIDAVLDYIIKQNDPDDEIDGFVQFYREKSKSY